MDWKENNNLWCSTQIFICQVHSEIAQIPDRVFTVFMSGSTCDPLTWGDTRQTHGFKSPDVYSLVRWHCVFANVNVPGNCQEVERSLSRNKSQDWVLLCGSALLLSLRWKFPHSWTRTCRTITSPNHSPRWVGFVILLSLKCINIKLKCNKYIIHDIIKLNSAPAKRNLSTIWSQVLECISRTLVALYCLSWSPLTFLQGGSDRWQGNANCRQGPSQSVQWGASWGPEHDGTAGEGGEAGKPKAITSFWDTDFLDRNI